MTEGDFDQSDYSDSDLDTDGGGGCTPRWLLMIAVVGLVLMSYLVVGYEILTFR